MPLDGTDVAAYCRDIEAHLCRSNDGHLIRIVGPSFEMVSRWATQGVPLKVAYRGIDRYFERYYRKGPRRRPVKIDFCEADVLDVFDEWRRATGLAASDVAAPAVEAGAAQTARKRGGSLPEHLERVLLKLSSLRATSALPASVDSIIDRVSAELDVARGSASGLRGDARRAAVERLARLDAELIAHARELATPASREADRRAATEELIAYRAGMTPDVFERTVDLAMIRILRERLGLPTIALS
jgi:hypothetical protein